MPVTRTLPVSWHETPNIHLCTIDDFRALARERGWRIEQATYLARGRRLGDFAPNWRADQAVFVLRR